MNRAMKETSAFAALVFAAALFACSAPPKLPPAVDAEAPARADYVIGAGDILRVTVWKNPELSVEGVPVRPDGKISVPLLDDVQAHGLTAAELKELLTTRLNEYVTNPDITVVVLGVNSKRAYLVGGGIARSGPVDLKNDMRVLDAISQQGGFTPFADKKNIKLIRRTENGDVEYTFNYNAYVSGEAPGSNFLLQPGDTVVVPQ